MMKNIRIDPYPVVAIFRRQSTKLDDLVASLHFADVVGLSIFPLLVGDFFILPGVGEDSVGRDIVIRDEVFHLPIMRIKESHV